MHRMHAAIAAGLWLSLGVAGPALAQTPPTNTAHTRPDNTRVNRSDALNADTQRNDRRDLEITQKIRRAIMADRHLSTYAHNVKIITEHGEVTLKGPVRNESERKAVTAKAIEVAGRRKVANELTIAR